jgi:uracil-DNA glycosylase
MFREQSPKSQYCKDCLRYANKRCSPSELVSSDVDILFIGVQPDTFSASNNIPFYGHGGAIIKKAVSDLTQKNLGYDALTLRHTYAVQCMGASGTDVGAPPKRVSLKCLPFLMPTILSAPPKVIIALGAEVLKQLGIKGSFNELRGKILPLPNNPTISVLVTFSEDALVAKAGFFHTFSQDLYNAFDRAVAVKTSTEKVSLETISKDYRYPQTVEEVIELCDEILRFDNESRKGKL